jgi:hypothetical protein
MEIEFTKSRKPHGVAGVELTLRFGAVVIRLFDWRLYKTKAGELAVSASEWGEKDGRGFKYHETIQFDDATRQRIDAMILGAWHERGEKI